MSKIFSIFHFTPGGSSVLHDYIVGASTIVDILPDYESYSVVVSDVEALASDWRTVRVDFDNVCRLVFATEFKRVDLQADRNHVGPEIIQAARANERFHTSG